MTLQNAPPGLDYERDRRFSKVRTLYNYKHLTNAGFSHITYVSFVQSFKELVGTCLVKDPKKRPTSEKLLKHPFFKQARAVNYLARTILDGLAPLGDRFRTLKVIAYPKLLLEAILLQILPLLIAS